MVDRNWKYLGLTIEGSVSEILLVLTTHASAPQARPLGRIMTSPLSANHRDLCFPYRK